MEKPVRFSENDSSFIDICRTISCGTYQQVLVFENTTCIGYEKPWNPKIPWLLMRLIKVYSLATQNSYGCSVFCLYAIGHIGYASMEINLRLLRPY